MESHTHAEVQNRGKGRYRLNFILTRQPDGRLVQNVTAPRPPPVQPESGHNLPGNGRHPAALTFCPQPPQARDEGQTGKRPPKIDGKPLTAKSLHREIHPPYPLAQMWMAWQRCSLNRCCRLPLNIAPRAIKRSQGPAGWCASKETEAEMLAACREREAA